MTLRIEDKIEEVFSSLPNEPLLCWQNTWWSRAAFMELVEECERILKDSGFTPGQKLALLLPNSPIMLAITIAVWKLRGTIVPIDPKSGYLAIVTQLIHADVFAVISYKGCETLASLITEEGIPCYIVDNLDAPGDIIAGRVTEGESEEIAVIFYTSGTTGRPKAVPLTHKNLLAFFDSCTEHFKDINDDDVFFNGLPNFNAFGLIVTSLLPMLLGAKQLVRQSFMPVKNTLRAMKVANVTILIAVPMMLSMIFRAAKNGAVIPTTLRYIISGADRLPESLKQKAIKYFGLEITEGYGLTEASSVVTLQPLGAAKNNTLGTFLSCVKGEVRDEDGNILPAGEAGELWISGASVTNAYYRDPDLTNQSFEDGWFNTGDIVIVDNEGYLTLVGRTSDVIFVGGFKIYPAEVEKTILEYPGVAEVAVVGVPRHISGEIVKACIVLKDGHNNISTKDISDYCKQNLAYYKVPRIIEFVDTMPRSPIGDVLKRNLINE